MTTRQRQEQAGRQAGRRPCRDAFAAGQLPWQSQSLARHAGGAERSCSCTANGKALCLGATRGPTFWLVPCSCAPALVISRRHAPVVSRLKGTTVRPLGAPSVLSPWSNTEHLPTAMREANADGRRTSYQTFSQAFTRRYDTLSAGHAEKVAAHCRYLTSDFLVLVKRVQSGRNFYTQSQRSVLLLYRFTCITPHTRTLFFT